MSTRTHGAAARAGRGHQGRKGRRPVAPVRAQSRNWGPLVMFGVVALVAAVVIGFAWVASSAGRGQRDDRPWFQQVADIEGVVNYRLENPDILTREHVSGRIQYPVLPPVGGNHNPRWQRCDGQVYDAPIPSEHAVHSLEHGAVWVTYHPDLPEAQVDRLANLVRGRDYVFMSPFPNLDAPISLQAWGYQLKVDRADDERIDRFIRVLRINASVEPNATCRDGNTQTGDFPIG